MRAITAFFLLLYCICVMDSIAQVQFKFDSKHHKEGVILSFKDSSYRAVIDSTGTATISVPAFLEPGYGSLYEINGVRSIYIIPGKAQSMQKNSDGRFTFKGSGAAINTYLHSHYLLTLDLPYEQDEQELLASWRNLYKDLSDHLYAQDLPQDFIQVEERRLYYLANIYLLSYPLHHVRRLKLNTIMPSEAYFQLLDTVMVESNESTGFSEYWQAFRNWIDLLANHEVSGSIIDKLAYKLNFTEANIQGSLLRSTLIYSFLYGHLRYEGAEGVEELVNRYIDLIQDQKSKIEIEQLYEQHVRLIKGRKAPEFLLLDAEGREVKLSDFRGKYVYMDVWATWCMPCLKEIPHMQKLESELKDRDIVFLSVSIDQDIKTWKYKVVKDKMSGHQLHVGSDRKFVEDYKISLIPRFFLIDPKGQLVDANMTRPSDPETLQVLSALE